MALKVEINLPHYPKNAEIGITGIGVIKNGGSIEIGEAQEKAFYDTSGVPLQEAVQEQDGVNVTGSSEFTPLKKEEEEEEVKQETPVVAQKTGLPPGTTGEGEA